MRKLILAMMGLAIGVAAAVVASARADAPSTSPAQPTEGADRA